MTDIDYSASTDPATPFGTSTRSGIRSTRAGWKRALNSILPLILQRLAFGLVVLLAIIYLTYLGLDMARGAEFNEAVRGAIPQTIQYVGNLLRGDLGVTTAGSITVLPVPVSQVIAETLPRSLGLLGIALLFAALIGITIGILAARSQSRRSIWLILTTIIGISIPSFFAAFLLQWGLTTYTRAAGRPLLPVGGFGWDSHLILPVLVLSARPIAQITRITFGSVRETSRQDFTRTALGKGLRRLQVLAIHIMRNAAIPILTTIGVSLSFMLSSLPVVELYFGWPGVGFTLLKSIARQDDNLTIALLLCLGAVFILVNLLLEITYRLIDPRLQQTPAHIASGGRQDPLSWFRSLRPRLVRFLHQNAISRWIARRKGAGPADSQATLALEGEEAGTRFASEDEIYKRSTWKPVLRNTPLLIGGFLVLVLILMIFAGPALSPNNPFSTQGLVWIEGALTPPPFAPNETYPWGTDALGRGLMSLIFTGAQQTLTLAVLAVAARALVGVSLGALAGWRSGGLLDRMILGIAEIIAAYPALLLTMIVILALGIRQGMSTFVIALCVVGWGEIMHYVRGEVIRIRPEPYIESAVAVGARTPRIVGRHILPHLFSALISIIALEMGAVLMLLGELGFIGIFIGGGILIALPSMSVHYSDVPEWGALLSNIRFQARSFPWTGLYPMLAFFLAILSFNLFGEGLRRMVDEGTLIISRIFNRYTVMLVLAVALGVNWLQNNSGAYSFYREYAESFDGQQALRQAEVLTNPQMDGRALGTLGMQMAANYLAAEFEALGLQSAGSQRTYVQRRVHAFERLDAIPTFEILDGGSQPVYGQDFAAYPGRNVTAGQAAGPVRVVVLGARGQSTPGSWRTPYPDLERADYSQEILLVFSQHDAWTLAHKEKQGMLVVTEDASLLGKRFTLSGRTGRPGNWQTGERFGEETPYLWISKEMADRLLAGSEADFKEVQQIMDTLGTDAVYDLPLPVEVNFEVAGTLVEKWPVYNVLGIIPGAHGYDLCADCLGKQLIVVTAQYDSPPPGPEGVYEAANDNASGVAVMLEAIRVLMQSDYISNKTIMFVAYSGEGLDGGEPISDGDVEQFLKAHPGFSTEFNLEAVLNIGAVGGGGGDGLQIAAGGSLRLADLFEKTARQFGVKVERVEEQIDIGVIYDEGGSFTASGQEAPTVFIRREGWETSARTAADTISAISDENLSAAGRTLAMTLMILGREINY